MLPDNGLFKKLMSSEAVFVFVVIHCLYLLFLISNRTLVVGIIESTVKYNISVRKKSKLTYD